MKRIITIISLSVLAIQSITRITRLLRKNQGMKIITSITLLGFLALPFAASALTVRTEHRTSSGGVTVSEGAATVTGDESSSVSVQNIIQGTRGQVQVTTVKDGVTKTETRDVSNPNGDTVHVITPAPEPQDNDRILRAERGSAAVHSTVEVSSNSESSGTNGTRVVDSSRTTALPHDVQAFNAKQHAAVKDVKKIANPTSFVLVSEITQKFVSTASPSFLPHVPVQGSVDVSSIISRFISRIISMLRFA